MIESCFGNHLNVQHATDYMGTYLMYLWAINVIVIIDLYTYERGKLGRERLGVMGRMGSRGRERGRQNTQGRQERNKKKGRTMSAD